jgi:purine-binding chemotaxis protein CheW
MKSTLDSLFSSTKSQAQEPETPASSPAPEVPEAEAEEKVKEKNASVKKASAKKAAPAVSKAKPGDKKPPAQPKEPPPTDPPAEATPPPAFIPLVDASSEAIQSAIETTAASTESNEQVVVHPTAEVSTPVVIAEKPAPEAANPPQEAPAENALSALVTSSGETTEVSDEEEQLVVFLLAGEAYGISIQMVESIIKKQAITKVPHVDKYILGVTNLRGTVVPVVDLRLRFSIPEQETTKDTRIIVLNTESGKNGILVDEVMEVMRLPKSAIAPPPMIATSINTSYIQGIARTDDKLIIMLEMNTILQR